MGTGSKSVFTSNDRFYTGMTNQQTKNAVDSQESFLSFDFSTLPSGTINSASISLTVVGNSTFFNDYNANVNIFAYDWGATIDTTDYIAASATSGLTLYAIISAPLDSGPTTYTSAVSSQLISEIQNRRLTKMAIVSDSTINYTRVGGNRSFRQFGSPTYATTAYRPVITISLTESVTQPIYNLIVSPL